MRAQTAPEDLSCDKALGTCPRCRIAFAAAVGFGVLYLISAGVAVFSVKPPTITELLLPAAITFAAILGCLEIAASTTVKRNR